MLTEDVTYTDYNGQKQTDTLYFNLNRVELGEMLDMEPRLNAFMRSIEGEDPEAKASTPQILDYLDILKTIVRRAYGVRSDDGKRFIKTDYLTEEFEQSAAYDEFVYGLFTDNGESFLKFITGLVPAGMADAVAAQNTVELPQPELSATEPEQPAYIRENRMPTPVEVQNMSHDELQIAFAQRLQQNENN